MDYETLCKVYSELESTPKGLEKTKILSEFLGEIKATPEFIYLLRGKVFADYDSRELGFSQQLAVRAIAKALGEKDELVINSFKNSGDLGSTIEDLFKRKQQLSLFSKKLTVEKVLTNLKILQTQEGTGSVDKKIGLIIELLNSASAKEAKYIMRTVIGDMKIGVGDGLLRDSIVEFCFKPKDIEQKKQFSLKVQEAYDKVTDFAEVFEKACKNQLGSIKLSPGKPVKVMLFPKAKNVEDAFRIVGKPAAFEYKYDGFRVMINKDEKGKIKIFTRRLEEVTKQFPEIVEYVAKNVYGKTFILDGEAVGFNAWTKEYTDFQAISQRIRRKYDIEAMAKNLPIELVLFDIIFYEGKNLIEKPFEERRNLIKKITTEEKFKIILAKQIISENIKEVETFYTQALEEKQEGLMAKSLSAPYKPGARVGYAVKLKPVDKDFDLVITGAEWGTGKRAGWLTSFNVSCRDESGGLLEIGKVSTGLKEKKEEGLSYEELTEKMKALIITEDGTKIKVKPEVVVSVQYQNIQKSPTYSSGFALRFPRILRLREDRGIEDITTVQDIESEVN
ncbi:ATP-dependent DNA ligase [archaeon]|nr:ATP-dependent DNA ligase [archaeon]